ncbi:helix-turn-helix transcriptional regulator [Steroidobacter sp. S1-65]|uniref:Helix-turn-helix transcriptional regulator n=1 Tax=Steroidobacter gossypii TaxID=2805490 RepID=A0ABS1X5X1_9GAMM|nr:helix-turn-helix transcriptional regulator [Steroidobacter gossypii]MBM0108610.1 helix-turn-helix transcriptional regulator [Steroidobacter gossypii]
MSRSAETPFVRAVKRAFADALLAEIGRTQLRRNETATSGHVSRSYLQYLLKAQRHATIGTVISLAEGLGVRPEDLMARVMEHLCRIRGHITPPRDGVGSSVHDDGAVMNAARGDGEQKAPST